MKAHPEHKASFASQRENYPTTDSPQPELKGWIFMASSRKFASRPPEFKTHSRYSEPNKMCAMSKKKKKLLEADQEILPHLM